MSFGTGGVVYHSFIILKIFRDFPLRKIPVAVPGASFADRILKEKKEPVPRLI